MGKLNNREKVSQGFQKHDAEREMTTNPPALGGNPVMGSPDDPREDQRVKWRPCFIQRSELEELSRYFPITQGAGKYKSLATMQKTG